MLVRIFKAGSSGFTVYVKHARGYSLKSRVKHCLTKEEVGQVVESETKREEGRGQQIAQ